MGKPSAKHLGQWGALMSIAGPKEGERPDFAKLAAKWEIAAQFARAEAPGEFDDEADTLEHCARELRAWLDVAGQWWSDE